MDTMLKSIPAYKLGLFKEKLNNINKILENNGMEKLTFTEEKREVKKS